MRLYRNTPWLAFVAFLFLFLAFIVVVEDMHNIAYDSDLASPITGNDVYTKAEIVPTTLKNCSFTLYPGWNMVSFYCLGLFNSRAVVLQPVEGFYDAIFEYQSNDENDPWKSYNPDLPAWAVQQLNYMDRLSGYWIYMYNQINFSYAGVYSDSIINLYTGWNLVGYPNTNTSYINYSLAGIPFTVVKHYNKGTVFDNETNETYYTGVDTWLIYVNGSLNNTLEQFEAYKGYWINVTEDDQWNITRG